jgi:coproporphyrinogen III oxidase-like Fe-S oxidoreductase
MASPPRVTEENLACLAEAGLWRIRIGIESGSERTKGITFERPISNASVLQAARLISWHREVVAAYFLINGNPYEEQEDLLQTLQLMAQLPQAYYAQIFNLVFFPGTSLYRKAVADGIIRGIEDSGAELHYRNGFQYRQHAWKNKNLYLNVLSFLMEGKATKYRLGLLPRFLLPALLRPGHFLNGSWPIRPVSITCPDT